MNIQRFNMYEFVNLYIRYYNIRINILPDLMLNTADSSYR